MPYKKPKPLPFQSVAELIRGKGISSPQLANILGCSANTALKKLKDPKRITLEDIGKLHRTGHIPIEELRGAIRL